jgi:Family of unknown function (DUF6493)
MTNLIQLIRDTNYQEIIKFCSNLGDLQRYETIVFLKSLDTDKDIIKIDANLIEGEERKDFYAKRATIFSCFHFAMIACTREYSDIEITEKSTNNWYFNSLINLFASCNKEALIQFYTLFPPNYLDKFLTKITKDRFNRIDFKLLWKLYEKGWVTFNEEMFLRSLLVIHMFGRDTQEDADFLFEHPEALKKVFLTFYAHEMPVLDISKWTAREGFVCKKVNEFWTEVIIILMEKGVQIDRTIVPNLLKSLLHHWKKPHLDWHVRLLELFNPTKEEYFENQNVLVAILGTGNPSLINFAISKINTICNDDKFDEINFIDNVSLIFTNEKCAKSILIALNIIEIILHKPENKDIEYSENFALLLMQTDAKVQEKAATMLLKFAPKEQLQTIVLPYLSYLKQKTKDILSVSAIKIEDEIQSNLEISKTYQEVSVPKTWNDLFYLLGTCIKTKSPLDTDLFFEGLNQLQNEIPSDYAKQLQPFIKQLNNKFWNDEITRCLSIFVEAWTNKTPMKPIKDFNTIPFLWNKCNWLIKKLNDKNDLPFLSTPTHEPFYIHPNVLIYRLLEYEKYKKPLHLEDLIVACNRLLLDEIDEQSIELVKLLKGDYAKAIQYYFGVSNEIKPTETDLPLWTQITRIKNPNQEFTEFEATIAKDIPSVVKPFYLDFSMKITDSKYSFLEIEKRWNRYYYSDIRAFKDVFCFYNVATSMKGFRITIPYQFSLNPHYLDLILCRFIPLSGILNEVSDFEDALIPLQFLLEHDLKIYHSGWIYIATCLIFEKKISRDLAAEYIQIALVQRNENLAYLADVIGKLIAQKYAPINRLIEYFDKPFVSKSIQTFQQLVLEKCIEHFDTDNLPTNSKKIFTYYEEWSNVLKIDIRK